MADRRAKSTYDPANLAYREKEMRGKICKKCNSACAIHTALKKDLMKYARFVLTG